MAASRLRRPGAVLLAAAGLLALAPLAARADRGALSLDAGAGMSALRVTAPYSAEPKGLRSLSGAAWVGTRYALANWLELGVSGFFEPPVTLWHNGVRVEADGLTYPGTLTHQMLRYGVLAGPRLTYGMVWRFSLGVEAGLSRRVYSGLQALDDSLGNGEAVDYGLRLPDSTLSNLAVSPYIAVEWAGGDTWSISVLPRAQFLLGDEPAMAVIVPVAFSWSWYL